MEGLSRLLELSGLNKIDEIKRAGIVDVGELPLSHQEIYYCEQVSTVMQFPLYKFEKEGQTYFYVTHDERVIAWTYGSLFPYTDKGDTAFVARRSFVVNDYRNKGIMYNIYSTVNQRLKLAVMSDNEQSVEAQSLWGKIFSINKNLKSYNSQTGEISDITSIDDVYDDPNGDLHLLWEMSQFKKRMCESTSAYWPHDMIIFNGGTYNGYP